MAAPVERKANSAGARPASLRHIVGRYHSRLVCQLQQKDGVAGVIGHLVIGIDVGIGAQVARRLPRQIQPQFLLELPHQGFLQRFAGIDEAPRQIQQAPAGITGPHRDQQLVLPAQRHHHGRRHILEIVKTTATGKLFLTVLLQRSGTTTRTKHRGLPSDTKGALYAEPHHRWKGLRHNPHDVINQRDIEEGER